MKDVLMAAYAVGYKNKQCTTYLNSQKYEADASKMASAERALMCSMNFEFNIEHAYPYVYEVVETCGKNACGAPCASSIRPATGPGLSCTWRFCATASPLQLILRKAGRLLWSSEKSSF
ncbi:unnamed protein product [Ascophyllum nodosum]